MKKMNNKGFSLVELIVVVLIMAIIAVALAPQVMKWVENSRKSTDIENYNSIMEACNVASTNEDVIKDVGSGSITITMTNSGSSITAGSSTHLSNSLDATLPGWGALKITSGDWNAKNFTITVKKSDNGIQVVRGNGSGTPVAGTDYPDKDFS